MATFTQDEYKIRSIDVVHINPSLLEGEVNYTSIIGPDRAVRLERYAPISLVDPVISGPETIPGVLSCFPGVWDGSPTPKYTYQWFSDGSPISGQTNATLETDVSMSDTEITCDVTATNTSGSAGASSNGITVSIVEPIRMEEFEHYGISGLNQVTRQNMMVFRGAVVSGMWNDPRFDMMGFIMLPITGMWRQDRFDTMQHLVHLIHGLGQEDTSLVHGIDNYAAQYAQFDKALTVLNPSAADGTNNWTQDPSFTNGSLSVDTTRGVSDSNSFQGAQGTPYESDFYQDISIDPTDYADVDNRDAAVDVHYWDNRVGNFDYVGMYYEALNDSDSVIGTFEVAGRLVSPSLNAWSKRVSGVQDLPPGTRKIRLHMLFSNQIFNDIDTRIDDISLDLYKYTIIT